MSEAKPITVTVVATLRAAPPDAGGDACIYNEGLDPGPNPLPGPGPQLAPVLIGPGAAYLERLPGQTSRKQNHWWGSARIAHWTSPAIRAAAVATSAFRSPVRATRNGSRKTSR